MKAEQNLEGYRGIYLERSGKDSRSLSEILVAPPELPLDESQKQEVYKFEKDVYSHELGNGMTVDQLVKSHKGETTTAPRFFAEAFLKNKVDLSGFNSESGEPLEFSSSEEVYCWLAKLAQAPKTDKKDEDLFSKKFLKMAQESATYYKKIVADDLLSGETPDDATLDYMSIVVNPTEMIKNSMSMVEARGFLHDMRLQYKEGGDRLDGAKRAISDVYLAKVNNLVVNDIITLEHLADQSRLIGDSETELAAECVVPAAFNRALDSNRLRTLRRLDYIRNGIGSDENGQPTSVDNVVIHGNRSERNEVDKQEPLFNPEQRKKIKSFKLTPQEMVEFYSQVLKKGGLLSSEDPSTWTPKRPERAADGLFQVVINPEASNFSIGNTSGVYKVAAENRSLFDVIVIGGFHELEHVNQAQVDRVLGEQLKIANLRGKRVSMYTESGANFKQREAEMALFGECKPIALAYSRALQVLEKGGDTFMASKAFFDEKRRILPDNPPAELAKEAADRVLRLVRHGGLDSQSMSYAEEIILNDELQNAPEEIKSRAIAVTSLDLVDQVRLHKYGLLELPEGVEIDWTEIILKQAEPYIMKALSTD